MDNKVQKIKIDEDISTKIEALQYEIDTRKEKTEKELGGNNE